MSKNSSPRTKARLHLISAPWASPRFPSIQLGALKSYIDAKFAGDVETFSYSAFLAILYRVAESRCLDYYDAMYGWGEALYMILYHESFSPEGCGPGRAELKRYLGKLSEKGKRGKKLHLRDVNALGKATREYVEEELLPNLTDDGVNVVGFSMNFKQVYPSLYIAKYLEKLAPEKKMVFLFGGFSAGLPNIAAVLKKLGIRGFCVFGEGEGKLASILSGILGAEDALDSVAAQLPGVFPIGADVDLYERNEAFFQSEVKDIGELPLPEYEEYFSLHAKISSKDSIFNRIAPAVLPIEGTRGCFAKCDFCNLNSQWGGFRKASAAAIFERAKALVLKYGSRHLFFSDNVCDAFAEKFADAVLADPALRFHFFMELRAHHPEAFWVKLAKAGITSMQIGIEALSPPLLRKMAKGTLVIQNLRAQKYAKELGIRSFSGIITHHPKSEVGDPVETLRVLDQIGHLDPLSPNRFSIGTGSPIYGKLSGDAKRRLVPLDTASAPAALRPYVAGFGYEVPEELILRPELAEEWEEVRAFCNARIRNGKAQSMSVAAARGGGLSIVDRRGKKPKTTKLDGKRALVYTACHEGLQLKSLEERVGLPQSELAGYLEEMVAEKTILETDGYYLSMALRAREAILS